MCSRDVRNRDDSAPLAAQEPYARHFPREHEPQIRGVTFRATHAPGAARTSGRMRSDPRCSDGTRAREQRDLFRLAGFGDA